jgi:hypothetical protein
MHGGLDPASARRYRLKATRRRISTMKTTAQLFGDAGVSMDEVVIPEQRERKPQESNIFDVRS